MGYKAVYPQEAINGHRAFIARRRTLCPSEEYRAPTDAEWDEFLGHFERRKVALGECGRAYGTSCQHEHSCFSELRKVARQTVRKFVGEVPARRSRWPKSAAVRYRQATGGRTWLLEDLER
ncbi:hypothetical protein [Nocardia sp. NPDC005745]|uniref:hypothetical protein n=1 Tax=Nocardia sp. NPDC005745 TaxID=3157061 RepID=UPI0033C288B7